MTRDHGGDIDRAIARFGGERADWVDLSTGINPRAYPLPPLPATAWTALPTAGDVAALTAAARVAYGGTVDPLPLGGAQAAIQLIPRLASPGAARILGPTYNEHAAALAAAGWRVADVDALEALAGADLAVVVNPNNPTGRRHSPNDLLDLSGRVGMLVVDESFVDPTPELSLAPHVRADDGIVVLRSFGKFYGLAGLRLGFVLTGDGARTALASMAGPWAVSGPAIAVGRAALVDDAWRRATIARLAADGARLDDLAAGAGWRLAGGALLFRLYETPDARAAQSALARRQVWSRAFPYSRTWLRLGLPDGSAAWRNAERALRSLA